jgi:erythronate-4-phosphate dehydrogenase
MKIVADSGLFGIEELVAQLEGVCELQLLSGRDISPAQLRDAEALLVRSITPVNEAAARRQSGEVCRDCYKRREPH